MPFIAQCPHSACRKYLLLEDSSRGSVVRCLLCKQSIQVSAASPGQPPTVSVAAAPSAVRPPPRQIQTCPQCGASLMMPDAAAAPRKIKCGKCGHVFQTM